MSRVTNVNQDGARSGLRLPRAATRVQAQNREEFLYRVWDNKGRFSLQEDAFARRDEELGLVRKPPEKPIGGKWEEEAIGGKWEEQRSEAGGLARCLGTTPHPPRDPGSVT